MVCHRRGCRTGNFGAVLLPSDEVSIRPPALTFSTFSATEPHAQVIISTIGPLTLASFFGVPPVTAVAVQTVYVSKRDLLDAS